MASRPSGRISAFFLAANPAPTQFLLDTTLGLINLEQSRIIQLFSAPVAKLIQPTLIASICELNFKHMPELGRQMGHPLALALMVISSTLLYVIFRLNHWL